MATDDATAPDGPLPDPFEAELVAYLDGELDPGAARDVEARLARDPDARARAAELKKAFDLLDFLPKPEPSPTFTTRTLDKLPVLTSGSQPAAARAGPGRSGSAPVAPAFSTSMAVPLEPEVARARPLVWGAAVCAACACFAALGYTAAIAVRPYLLPAPRDKGAEVAPPEIDARVADHLPLYAIADDIAFVAELAKPDLFGDDPAVSYDPTLKVPPTDVADRPTGKDRDALAKAFRALPVPRQAEILRLDRELHAKELKERDRLFRALEAYAVWLDRLPEADRRGVLSAATPSLRLGVVRDIRDRQWLDALPAAVRGKPEQIQSWRDDEVTRRDRLAFARQHAEAFAVSRSPWPLDTDANRKEVQEFARTVFKLDDPKRRRLDPIEYAEYTRTLATAQRDDAWAWYGLLVYELTNQRPYLPEPADPKLMYADANDLPDAYGRFVKKALPFKLNLVKGRWPEFPLQLHTDIQNTKLGAIPPLLPPLGPTHYTEFKKPLPEFAVRDLFPRLTADERREMERPGGRWPEYSKRFVELAKKYDLSVPGVTPPGPPKRWDATYGSRPAGREK